MKISTILLLCLINFSEAVAQIKSKQKSVTSFKESEKFFTFNPLALAEPHIAIGAGFGNRFSERSEYFAELSFVTKPPFYDINITKLNGFRLITQYRYHFLQKWRPLINLGTRIRQRNARQNPFVGVEFRVKHYSFSNNSSGLLITNTSTGDILNNTAYNASALKLGAAIVFGGSYNIDDKWKLEITGGIGGRNKRVSFKNIPAGYEITIIPRLGGYGLPPIYENSEGGNIVYAVRVKYLL